MARRRVDGGRPADACSSSTPGALRHRRGRRRWNLREVRQPPSSELLLEPQGGGERQVVTPRPGDELDVYRKHLGRPPAATVAAGHPVSLCGVVKLVGSISPATFIVPCGRAGLANTGQRMTS